MLWSRNLQLHYPFQNTALDYSGNARHGTVNGSGVYVTRPDGGRCLYFDGVGDYVATPSFGLPATHTVVVFAADVRCKLNPTINQEFIGENSNSATVGALYCYRRLNLATLRWFYADGSINAAASAFGYFAAPYEDVWLHLCVACDYQGKYVYFYQNGKPFGSPVAMSGTPVFPSTARVKYIGSHSTTSNLLTDGYLANVYLGTLPTMPPAAQMLANANRLMLGMNPIW